MSVPETTEEISVKPNAAGALSAKDGAKEIGPQTTRKPRRSMAAKPLSVP